MLSYKQWRETRRFVDDLSTIQSDTALVGVSGFAYEGNYVIEKLSITFNATGFSSSIYFLQLDRNQWLCSDLLCLEGKLYTHYRSEQ